MIHTCDSETYKLRITVWKTYWLQYIGDILTYVYEYVYINMYIYQATVCFKGLYCIILLKFSFSVIILTGIVVLLSYYLATIVLGCSIENILCIVLTHTQPTLDYLVVYAQTQ